MTSRKKSLFFARSFYRWPILTLCLGIGVLCLLFYYWALSTICPYPPFFPIALFVFNCLVLVVSFPLVKGALVGGNISRALRIHGTSFFALLLISPTLAILFAEPFISALWAVHVACYIFYCLAFCGFTPRESTLTAIPALMALSRGIGNLLISGQSRNLGIELLYGLFTSLIYALIYFFLRYFLDIKEEVLSVYLENEELESFLHSFGLSPRELEVVGHIINGSSSRKIAGDLFISEGTVKNHTKSIYKKMGINGRMELMHLVWDFTLLKPGGKNKR